MVLYLEHILNGKMQTLNNVISVSENENIINVTTATENFKIDTRKVKFTLTVSINPRDKLMEELNIKLDQLLELQRNNKITVTDGLKHVEEIKEIVKTYDGVSDKDKKDIIDKMELLVFEAFMRRKLSE